MILAEENDDGGALARVSKVDALSAKRIGLGAIFPRSNGSGVMSARANDLDTVSQSTERLGASATKAEEARSDRAKC